MAENPLQGCPESVTTDLDPGRRILIVPTKNKAYLDNTELVDYYEYRKRFLDWLLHFGKNPNKAEGYSPHTVFSTGARTARFDLWRWEQDGEYNIPPRHDQADAYMKKYAYSDLSNVTKAKQEEIIKRYFKWLGFEYDADPWEPEYTFMGSGEDSPRDFFTKEERQQIRAAALNLGRIPSYKHMTPEERAKWKPYVAKQLSKPVEDVSRDDWATVNSWKETTLVWTSLDAGLRPIEVGRAKTSWVDTKNRLLRIPREESSKNKGNWVVSITDRTATALANWLEERELHEKYEGSDALWLTTHANPYGSKSLSRLIKNVCQKADIPTKDRSVTWYSIRHSVGTYMTSERDLAAAKAQLRHKSAQTTMKYDQVPVEDRRDALERMG